MTSCGVYLYVGMVGQMKEVKRMRVFGMVAARVGCFERDRDEDREEVRAWKC